MIIPEDDPAAIDAAKALLVRMMKIIYPTNDQKRFIGTLRVALGMQSNNQKRKSW